MPTSPVVALVVRTMRDINRRIKERTLNMKMATREAGDAIVDQNTLKTAMPYAVDWQNCML
jgi:uncharacterized protein involved in propanediol utilization